MFPPANARIKVIQIMCYVLARNPNAIRLRRTYLKGASNARPVYKVSCQTSVVNFLIEQSSKRSQEYRRPKCFAVSPTKSL